MRLRRYAAAVVLSTALAFIIPAGVDAASVATPNVVVSVGDYDVSSSKIRLSEDNVRFAQALSTIFNRQVPTTEIIRLRDDYNLGLGDISLAYATSHNSGYTVDEISRLRYYNKMGWGEIAKMYGVKVKDLKKGNHDVINAARDRGVDVTYIEVDNDKYYDHNDKDQVDDRDNHRDDKNEDKNDNNGNNSNNGNDKQNNGKSHEHKK